METLKANDHLHKVIETYKEYKIVSSQRMHEGITLDHDLQHLGKPTYSLIAKNLKLEDVYKDLEELSEKQADFYIDYEDSHFFGSYGTYDPEELKKLIDENNHRLYLTDGDFNNYLEYRVGKAFKAKMETIMESDLDPFEVIETVNFYSI